MDEVELLFTEALHSDRMSLYLDRSIILGKDKSGFIAQALKRRINCEPIQYILGKTEFMGLEFKVNQDVFIPRPETEILVETVIEYVTKSPCLSGRQAGQCASLPEGDKVTSKDILDIGTGSGCIAISLVKLLPNIRLTAIDVSKKALEIARYNAKLNNLEDKIKFLHTNLFTNYELRTTNYDIIVSNPPYVPTSEINELQPEIQYEPCIALDGGEDGLDFYRHLIAQSRHYLKRNGFLIMEMGYNQKNAIKKIFQNSEVFKIIEVIKDYNNIDRVVVTQLQ